MSDNALSEQAKVEMMKLAVGVTQQYIGKTIDPVALTALGVKGRATADVTFGDVVDHIYDLLCERLKP